MMLSRFAGMYPSPRGGKMNIADIGENYTAIRDHAGPESMRGGFDAQTIQLDRASEIYAESEKCLESLS